MEVQDINKGILYLVTTPIGNFADMTLRALRTLKECDIIVCEEYKEAVRLLKFFDIKKDLLQLNEHNEHEEAEKISLEILNGKKVALISDCGTPLFADPGKLLLEKCIEFNIKVEFLHGANSVLTALVLSGFDISRFHYLGFLSPKKEIREKELRDLNNIERTFVVLDTPYRLTTLINDIKQFLPARNLFLGINLTMNNEMQLRGTADKILSDLTELSPDKKFKGEFVLVVDKYHK
jgi:16S rRNA (cytidine1402-2'-O)-methyltransferase